MSSLLEKLLLDHQIIALLGQGDEVQAEGIRGAIDAQTHMGNAVGHRSGNGHVGEFLPFVAVDGPGIDA
jgi:hypothetical protein